MDHLKKGDLRIPQEALEAFINREMSWLCFARRVLNLAEDPETPLLERVKFAGIMGMIYDEFAMKRLGGLRRLMQKKSIASPRTASNPWRSFSCAGGN